ncbi:MAG: 30S ribosomal protein S20, partial [Bacteroidetes bacterium]|nr:30S ribosomal protein S20 [Bacteroidota bacterium]
MANHKSTIKRIRSTETRRLRNKYYGKTMRNAIREFRLLTVKKDAQEKFTSLLSVIDKNAKRNIIHK